MTVGKTGEPSERQRKEGSEGSMKKPLSITALSTIAVQTGQTQVVVSVLKSGSSVHLQLVHVHPGLCEIGSDREDNQTLLQEQKQLLEKLQKHEDEVLLSVQKKRAEQCRRRQYGWRCEEGSSQEGEEEEGVYQAMEKSLREGWTLLLRLMDRRLHALTLAADFYHTVQEFSAGIERLGNVEVTSERLSNAQVIYTSVRRDLLGKSLQLLSISSDLSKKLKELQKTEALQRRGHVLQEEEVDPEDSQCSWGLLLKLEKMVEALQEQRRAVDQEVKLQIQQVQEETHRCEQRSESCDQGAGEKDDWSFSLDRIMEQNLPLPESELDLKLKLVNTKIPPELPTTSSNQTRPEEDKSASLTDLVSISPTQTSASNLAEEDKLRVESRMGERELSPKCFDAVQEAVNENTSLESVTEEETQELTGEECIKVETESSSKLDNGSNDIYSHLGIRLDQQAEDVQTSELIKYTNKSPKNQQLDRKFAFLSNKLPTLNLPSLKMHKTMEERKDLTIFNSNPSKDEPEQECKKDTVIENSSLNFDASAGFILKEPVVEKKNNALEAKSECQFPDLGENRIESGLNESLDEKLDFILQKDIVLETRQLPKEDIITKLYSNRQPQEKIEKLLRSLPIFTLVPKKLQPKLQETHDLINIYTDETTSSEGKQKLESEVQLSSIQSNHLTLESTTFLKLVKMEDTKDIAALDNIQTDLEKEVENIAIKKCEELEKTVTVANETELVTPSATKSEHFSERFKRLQSKWHDRSSSPSPDIAPKLESEKMQRNVSNVKNVNIVAESKELSISKVSLKCEETGANISEEDCKTVTNVPSIELPERRLVHETGNIPIVETIIKVESSTVEKYEFQLEHSTAELKQQEAKRILRRDEIHKLQAIFDQLADKVNVWLDGCSSVLSVSSHPGACVSAAQHSLTTHTQLLSEAQAAGGDAESLVQTLDQMRSLCPDSTESVSMYPKLSARAEVILKDLSTVNATIKVKLQLLQPYVDFLQAAEEAQVDFEHLKRTYARSPEEEETAEEAGWQTALQKFFSTQELGNNYKKHLGEMMQVPGLNLQSLSDLVMETIESLKSAKDEVENLHKHYRTQMVKLREQKEYCLKYRQRLGKTVADLQSVSELLDSCTAVDLGSEQNTSRLQQQFILARPHFTKLDAEADFITTNFETVRGLQQRHELRIREKVTEEDVSALLDLHLRLKQKIEESVSILELSSSLHLIHKQLDERLQSKPDTLGLPGCAEEKLNLLKEQKEQIHILFNRASNLKMDICDGTRNSSVAGFRVEQLESSLQLVDSQRVAWLKAAARSEETLLREMKTHSLLQDIHQLRDSFKDLKKRFSNLKFNYLKRNDRRNKKAVRNQLQQVDMHEDKLQSLVSRLQTLTAHVHVEVKEWGGSRELEDPLNELHRQMGEAERSLREHRKTLDMTCTLQEAMEEYQFWCEEASGTISRVGKFSSECRSPEAVSALYRQFEKFVWPTVPQQEERISQITELATRLHGPEEGKRYIEKTVSKHSEMVTAIKKLSDGLLELEEKLKLESLKQQKDEEEVLRLENQAESIRKDADVKLQQMKDQEKLKPKEQVDNRIAQEAAEMYELKETGHTPELTNKHDGKEIPVRRHSFNRKPPVARKHTQTDGQVTSSFCSTHMFSLSCSPFESNRQVYAIISQSQSALPTQTLPVPGEAKMLEKSTAADVLFDTELHAHPEVLSEDSLSTDEYECPSPDDISLPPLAETPESVLIPSDAEEAMCFSSHHSHRSRTLSERRDSSEANVPSTNRVRTESGTFVPSPLTVQIPTQVQAEFTIMTEENRSTPAQAISFVSNNITALASRPADSIPLVQTRKDKNSPQNVTFTILNNHISDESQKPENYLSKSFPVCQETTCLGVKLSNHTNKSEICPKGQSSNILEGIGSQSTQQECNTCPADLLISKEHTFPYDVKISENGSSTDTETKAEVLLGCRSTAVIKETLFSQSSMTSTLVQGIVKPISETSLSASPSLHQSFVEDLKLPGIIGGLQQQSMECKDEIKSQNEQSKQATTFKNVAINFARPSQFIATTQESDIISHLNPSSNTEQNQTVDSFHETSTQQCVHDSGFTAQLGATPLPEAKAQALAQPANTHVTPSFTSHQLLTPDQDPDICQPCTIREEITLTPQIKGPSMQPHDQDRSCFTKPVSKATVLEGSPVMLEVEVTGQPEPTLTWYKDDRAEDTLAGNQSCAEGRVLDECETWLTAEDKLLHKINADGEDSGLMDDFYDIITSDWQTWFGTLCFVLWLLILIVV